MEKERNRSAGSAYRRAISLGALAGMRAGSAPALLAYSATDGHNRKLSGTLFASRQIAILLELMAAGELVVDKLPVAPDRIAPLSLLARAGSGALAGATAFGEKDQPRALGAMVGALAAITMAHLSFHARRILGQKLNLPDVVIAVAEDTLVATAGARILREEG